MVNVVYTVRIARWVVSSKGSLASSWLFEESSNRNMKAWQMDTAREFVLLVEKDGLFFLSIDQDRTIVRVDHPDQWHASRAIFVDFLVNSSAESLGERISIASVGLPSTSVVRQSWNFLGQGRRWSEDGHRPPRYDSNRVQTESSSRTAPVSPQFFGNESRGCPAGGRRTLEGADSPDHS